MKSIKKENYPSPEQARELFNYDGVVLTWRISPNGRVKKGRRAGAICYGRLMVMFKGKTLQVGRVIWIYVNGKHPDGEIDHINGNPLDNRIENLRDVTNSVNQQNLHRARKDNVSGLLGACWEKTRKKYLSRIGLNGKIIRLGQFDTAEEAHKVYLEAKRKIHEGCSI